MSHGIAPTARFSGRAEDYAKARPGYPPEVVGVLREECGLVVGSEVADLGSGTGIFTRVLLEAGARVHAVEPNLDMRREAEHALSSWPTFTSVSASAEATTLPSESVDLVTAAQAFHWFDAARVKEEMKRLLRAKRSVALVWNDRDLESTPFLREYEALLVARCPGYRSLQGKADTPEKFDALFGRGGWRRRVVPNEQRLDRDGLIARLASSSYAPTPSDPWYEATFGELVAIFERHAARGEVEMAYEVVLIVGRLGT
ncbi:MAG: class I SAM-dependent methyltransferase [Deltaproteobacteria bacterium]|nr:class I SAM-dependent methyltransferase [Deltaproteobacteria bacterium]